MVSEIFGGNRSIIAFVSVGLMGAGLLSDFIITLYWWINYYPWGIRYENTIFGICFCSIVCWICSFICLFVIILMLLSFFLFPRITDNNYVSIFLVTFTTMFGILSFISGFVCGCLGLFNKHNIYEYGKQKIYVKTKCYHYLLTTSHKRPFEYARIHKKAENYGNWLFTILKKIERNVQDEEKETFIESIKKSIDENKPDLMEIYLQEKFLTSQNSYKNDLCAALAGPLLIFSLLIFAGVLCFGFAAFCFGAGRILVSNV